jgi:hypothetical protein
MDIDSEFKNKNLLDTDSVTKKVEFEEYTINDDDYQNNNRNTYRTNNDTDHAKQLGGKNQNLNYLDDYTSSQYNSKRLDAYEKDFIDMYNKAREYRHRIIDVENKRKNEQSQSGGQQETQKKVRVLNPTVRLMLDLTKIMKSSGKYPEIKQSQFMQISKMIVDDAKKQTGMQEVNDTVKQSAMQLAKNPQKYIERFKNQQSLKDGNSDTKSGSNFRGNDKMKNFRDNKNSDKNPDADSWRGSDSNYRNYAQANLWNDRNFSKDSDDTGRDSYINRYGNNDRNDTNYTNKQAMEANQNDSYDDSYGDSYNRYDDQANNNSRDEYMKRNTSNSNKNVRRSKKLMY